MDKIMKIQTIQARNTALAQYIQYRNMKNAEFKRRILLQASENRIIRNEHEAMVEFLEKLCSDFDSRDSLLSNKYSI